MSNLTAEAREIATKLTSVLNTQYPQIDWPFQTMTVIVDDVLTALIAKVRSDATVEALERAAQVLCPWCGEEDYTTIFHHGEWRHYRISDQYVEYCKAHLIRCLLPDPPIRKEGPPKRADKLSPKRQRQAAKIAENKRWHE